MIFKLFSQFFECRCAIEQHRPAASGAVDPAHKARGTAALEGGLAHSLYQQERNAQEALLAPRLKDHHALSVRERSQVLQGNTIKRYSEH